MTQKANSK